MTGGERPQQGFAPPGPNADRLFAALLGSSAEGIILSRLADAVILEVSNAFVEISGYQRDELLGRPSTELELIDPSERQRAIEALRERGWVRDVTTQLRTKAGDVRDVMFSSEVLSDGDETYLLTVLRDVSESRRAEDELRKSRDRFLQVFELCPVPIAITRLPDGLILQANSACLEFFGWEAHEFIGRTTTDIDMWANPELRQPLISELQTKGRAHDFEMQVNIKGGAVRDVLGSIEPIELDGQPCLIGIFFDVTRRRQLEQEVKATAERLALVLDSTDAGTYGIDAEGRVTFMNDSAARALGYEPRELIGVHAHERIHDRRSDGSPYDWTECPSFLAIQRGEITRSDAELLWRRDGTPLPVEYATHPLRADGEVLGAVVSFAEITRRSGLSRALLGDAIDGVSLNAVRSRRIIDVSDSFCALTGHARDELVGRTSVEAGLVMEDSTRIEATRNADAGLEGLYEARLRRKDGTHRWVQFSHRMLGQELVLTLIRDVTRRHALEDQLRAQAADLLAARDEAVAANFAKSEFLSRMSHELRTPLNAILGFGELLELDPLTPEQGDSVVHIRRAGRHLLALIDEVLDISRIETGELALSLEPVKVDGLVREAVDIIRPLTSRRRVTLTARLEDCEAYVLADRQRLKQVLLNLLSNAVKYNRDEGRVSVTCEAQSGERLRISVADTGVGISEANLDRLFTPFDRLGADQSDTEGTGLGLALSKRLVEAMRGAIGAESRVGVGTTFWLELGLTEAPVAVELTREPEPAVAATARNLAGTVLYVEDNLSNLQLVERITARRPGVNLLSAMQGTLGLELAALHRPDLILLDLNLPDMSGDEVLRRLRASPTTAGTPIVIMSADASPGQIHRLLASGATDYLTKPFQVARLLEWIDRALAPSPETTSSGATVQSPEARRTRRRST